MIRVEQKYIHTYVTCKSWANKFLISTKLLFKRRIQITFYITYVRLQFVTINY